MLPALVPLLCAASFATPAVAAPAHADRDGDRVYEDLESRVREVPADRPVAVIVVLRDEASPARVRRLEGDVPSLDSRRRFDIVDAFAGTVEAGQVAELAGDPAVEHVELDAPVRAFNASAQSSFGVTAARTAVAGLDGNAGGAAATYSKDDLVAAVIDTGIDEGHESLDDGKVLAFQDFTEGTYDADLDAAYDDNGHGTHVAGTIAGDGSGSTADSRGVAPAAALVGLKVLDASGRGDTSDVIAAIQWVTNNKATYGIEVVNMSLGSDGCSAGTDAEGQAVDAAVAAGLVVVVAAGNEGPGRCTIGSPGAVESALTVGAMADTGVGGFFMAEFSSRGKTADGRIKPDVVGPGVRITSAQAGTVSGYARSSGTSMAAPFVAGVALLMRDHDPLLTPAAIKSTIRATAVDWGRGGDAKTAGTTGADIDHGAGRLDAHAALAAVGAAVGAGPSVPGHHLIEGTLGRTGAQTSYQLTAAGASQPLAVTMTLAGDDTDNDGVSDPGADGCHAVDFDAYLYDASGTRVDIRDSDGASDVGAEGCGRSDVLWLPAGTTGTYTIRIVSWAGSGGFFLDVSGASAVAPSPLPSGGPPAITGTARDGGTLDGSPGTWASATSTSFAYQWQRCSAGGGSCTAISGATATTLALSTADIGKTLRVVVSVSNASGTVSARSAASSVVSAAAPPSAGEAPAVSGSAVEGATLTGSAGTWNGTAPVTLSRQWLRCDAAGDACAVITGKTGVEYVLSADDVGRRVRLRVTAANASGSSTRDSDATAVVGAKVVPAEPTPDPAVSEPIVVEPAEEPRAPAGPALAAITRGIASVGLTFACSSRCDVRVRLTAVRSLRPALGRLGRVLVSTQRSVGAGSAVVRARLKPAVVSRLRRAGVRRAKGLLVVRVTDAAGQTIRATRFVRIALSAQSRQG